MKKKTITLFGLGLMIFSLIPFESDAQFGTYYKQDDFCGRYDLSCTAVVTKCRAYGDYYCAIFEQIPCEEACTPLLSGI